MMLFKLAKYYLSLHYWSAASVAAIKKMQVKKFRRLFEHAKRNSKFYREFYDRHGVLDLKIESMADIAKVPIVSKAILRNYSSRDIMTRDLDERIHIHSTSGSTGEPFRLAFDKFADYTAHLRVFWALRKAGYRITDKIVMITRYNPEDRFAIEKDVSLLGMLQRKLRLFRREIISIYEPVDEIIAKLINAKARILWSTTSIMQIVGLRLKERGIKLDFPIIFCTSETISAQQKELFTSYFGRHIVSLYGAIESPSLGFDFGLMGRFAIFPNSNLFEFACIKESKTGTKTGNVIITNLLNKTMPIIRYDLLDLAEIDAHPGFGHQFIKKLVGRRDDIIELGNGKYLAHHHAHEMFMDFHECEMFKFIQKPDKTVRLQLKIADDQDPARVEKLAQERWRKRYGEVPLVVEFVDHFKTNPRSGKFFNIEIQAK